MKKIEIKKGDVYGKLTLTGKECSTKNGRYVECICECGNVKMISLNSLRQGKSKSCGCGMTTHNMTHTRIYTIYDHMKQRCNNKNNPNYRLYGGKGIKLLWDSFEDFYNDMGESYNEHVKQYGEFETTIDRIDSNGHYCKENCRRATHLEQSNNLSTNVSVVYKGKKYPTISSLCREYGLKLTTVSMRIRQYGFSLEDAIELPADGKTKSWVPVEYKGIKYESMSHLCRELGIALPTVLNRKRDKGISLEESIDISLLNKNILNDKKEGPNKSSSHTA